MEFFQLKIRNIKFHDPHFKKVNISKKIIMIKSLSSPALSKFDLVVLMTDHDCFNYKLIYKNSKKIIDCRGKFPESEKVIRG